jgi:hypothetical protein
MLNILIAQSFLSNVSATDAKPDARRLRTGHFTYRTVDHGKIMGKGEIIIHRITESGNNEISGEFNFLAEFASYPSQRWKSVATSELAPIFAELSFGQAAGNTPVFELNYTRGKVTGFFLTRKNSDRGIRRSIDAVLPANTFDQRIDWATVLARQLEAGQQFEFNVYDPGIGTSRVMALVGSIERVQVPAGSFEAYRVVNKIEKAGGTEKYQVFVSKDLPHVLVREEFPNGSIDELLEMAGGVDLLEAHFEERSPCGLTGIY